MSAPMPNVIKQRRHIRIQPSSGWTGINLLEMWEFRDLLWVLATRDIRLRYKQTLLGVIWVILQPLMAALIFAAIFGRIAHLPSDGLPYLLFVYAGLLPWNLFSASLQRAGASLIGDSKLISKVYFPRMTIPMASTAAVLVDFGVSLSVMGILMLIYQVPPSWNLLALPALLLLTLLVTLGLGLGISALNVYYRDFMYALPFVIQAWMFASPVVYSSNMIPDKWRILFSLNPMAGVIDGFRWSLLDTGAFPICSVMLAVVIGSAFFICGVLIFRRVERNFADVI